MNTELGREILGVHDARPQQLKMSTWGREGLCGTVACIAGWALLLSGWELEDDLVIQFRKGGRTLLFSDEVREEARRLLDLSDAEYEREYNDERGITLFDNQPTHHAIAWLREITEAAEAAAL